MDPQTELAGPLRQNNQTPTPDDIRDSKEFVVFSSKLMSFHELSQKFQILSEYVIRGRCALKFRLSAADTEENVTTIQFCRLFRDVQFEIEILAVSAAFRENHVNSAIGIRVLTANIPRFRERFQLEIVGLWSFYIELLQF